LSIISIANWGKEETALKFAKTVFIVAGILGILELLPPAINHPEFYFGFAGVALVWQVVFLLISTDPYRYRVFMLPSILEKASYVLALLLLSAGHCIAFSTALPAIPDLVLGFLFLAAYVQTGTVRPQAS
jgi:hypothetical protein